MKSCFRGLTKKQLVFFSVVFIFSALSSGAGQCGDLHYAVELMTRTTCHEGNKNSCAVLNVSRLFRSHSDDFLFFATMEKLPATKLNSMASSQLDIEGMHKLIGDYNHARGSHDIYKAFTRGTGQTPGAFARMAAESKAKGPDGKIDQEVFQEKLKKMGDGSREYYEREVLPIRRAIYRKLGFEAEGDGFTRVREAEDFIRAWREARQTATTDNREFDPDKNASVKAAWKDLFRFKSTVKTGATLSAKPGSGAGQNVVFGVVEALNRGPVKILDVARSACPKGSFTDYDQLSSSLKELFEKEGCQLVISSQSLTTVFNDFADQVEPDKPLCRLLENQRKRLLGEGFGDVYRDIEVPQNPEPSADEMVR